MDAIAGVLKYGALGLSALLALWTALLLRDELKRHDDVRRGAHNLIKLFMLYSTVLLAFSIGFQVYEKWLIDRRDKKLEFVRSEINSMNKDALLKIIYTIKNQSDMGRIHAENLANFSDSICEHINRIASEIDAREPSRRCDELERLRQSD